MPPLASHMLPNTFGRWGQRWGRVRTLSRICNHNRCLAGLKGGDRVRHTPCLTIRGYASQASPEATHHASSGFTSVSFRCLIAGWVERFHVRMALVFQEETRPSLASREGLFTTA